MADRSAVAEIADAMFTEIIEACAPDVKEMAVDSTGIQTTAASAYFQTRSGRKNTKYVKLSLAFLCGSVFPCGLVVSWGPRTDRAEAPEILEKAMAEVWPKKLYADAGYDPEWVHAVCREHWNVESFIPPSVHRNGGSVGGDYSRRWSSCKSGMAGVGTSKHS